MVDGISQNELNALTRYSLGLPEDEKQIQSKSVDGFVTAVAAKTIWDGSKWILANKNKFGELKTIEQGLKGKNIWETVGNFNRHSELNKLAQKYPRVTQPPAIPAGATPDAKQLKALQEYNKSLIYKKTRKLINRGKHLSGKQYKANLSQIEKSIARANLRLHQQRVAGNLKPTSWYGKLGNNVKNYTGINKITEKGYKLVAKSKPLQSVAKLARGKGALTVIAAVPEALNVAETYNKLGAKAGNKQLVKSAAVFGTEIATFAVGMKAGAALGATIGSVIPGAGTIVGGVLGAVIGIGASYFAGKKMQEIVGKPELELAQDKAAAQLAKTAETNQEILGSVLLAATKNANGDPNTLPDNLKPAYNKAIGLYENLESSDESGAAGSTGAAGANTETAGKTSTSNTKGTISEQMKKFKERLLAFVDAMNSSPYGKKDDWNQPASSMAMYNPGMNMGANMGMFNPGMNYGGMMPSYMG